MAKKEEEENDGLITPGEVGPLADTELEVEETETKPILDVKLETEIGPLNGRDAAAIQSNASRFFAVKKEEVNLSW